MRGIAGQYGAIAVMLLAVGGESVGQTCPTVELPSMPEVMHVATSAGSQAVSFHFVAPRTGIYWIFGTPSEPSDCNELSMTVRAESCSGEEIEQRDSTAFRGPLVWVSLDAGDGIVALVTDGCRPREFRVAIELQFEARSVTSDFALPFNTFDLLQRPPQTESWRRSATEPTSPGGRQC